MSALWPICFMVSIRHHSAPIVLHLLFFFYTWCWCFGFPQTGGSRSRVVSKLQIRGRQTAEPVWARRESHGSHLCEKGKSSTHVYVLVVHAEAARKDRWACIVNTSSYVSIGVITLWVNRREEFVFSSMIAAQSAHRLLMRLMRRGRRCLLREKAPR